MSITWWSPTSDSGSAHRAMDRLFEQFFGESTPDHGRAGDAPTYYLPVDVFESDAAYTLVASVPGFKQDQVEITYEDGIISIKARAAEHQAPGRWLRQERPHGSFVRRLEVPQQVETGQISAEFEHGVLTVTIPKTAKPQPVKIQIGSSHRETAAKAAK